MNSPKKLNFDDLPISTMVNIVELTSSVYLDLVFSLIPLYYPKIVQTNAKKIEFPPVHDPLEFQQSQQQRMDYGYCFPGDITHVGHKQNKRGFIRSKKSTFRNAIGCDVATQGKFVNCRINYHSIQISGSKSKEMSLEAANHIIRAIHYVQSILDQIQYHPKTVEWVIENTKGSYQWIVSNQNVIIDQSKIFSHGGQNYSIDYKYEMMKTRLSKLTEEILSKIRQIQWSYEKDGIHSYSIFYYVYHVNQLIRHEDPALVVQKFLALYHHMDNANIVKTEKIHGTKDRLLRFKEYFKYYFDYYQSNPVYCLVEWKQLCQCPSEYHSQQYPEGIDPNITNYLISLLPDYIYHHTYEKQIRWLTQIERVFAQDDQGSISVKSLKFSKLNYNYNLGNNVLLHSIVDSFEEYADLGITAIQDEVTQTWVTIHIPYEIPENIIDQITKRDDKRVNTFLIHPTGSVTQSGPHKDICRDAFNLFMQVFEKIKSKVCDTPQITSKVRTATPEDFLKKYFNYPVC